VNDVAANRTDSGLWEVVAAFGAGYVAMHMQGDPESMQNSPTYDHVVGSVVEFFGDRLSRLKAAGIDAAQIVLDPGIGFGKTLGHNLDLLAGLAAFHQFHRPLMIGVSRKSFLGALLGAEPNHRLAAGLACTDWARREGAMIFRTHDVAATVQSLRMTEALLTRVAVPTPRHP
jgi:dihydropteroate synthase